MVIEEVLVDPTRSICTWCYFVIADWGLPSLTWNRHNCRDEGAKALLVLYAPPSGNFAPFPLVTLEFILLTAENGRYDTGSR